MSKFDELVNNVSVKLNNVLYLTFVVIFSTNESAVCKGQHVY